MYHRLFNIAFFLFFLFLLINSLNIYSQKSYPDTLQAYYTTEKIVMDGSLDETSWQQAMKISNFTQRELNEGRPPTEKTRVAVLYDVNNLYIGFWGFDNVPSKIIAQRMKRDFRWSSDDDFEVIISPFNDNRNGYLFVTNPNGARADVLILNEGEGRNKDWNGVWDVATTVTYKGWFAEMVIPFSTLKFSKQNIQTWGINFERNIRRKKEQLLWQGWYRIYNLERISQGGTLTGLQNIKAKNRIEIKPYFSGGVEKVEQEHRQTRGKIGGDVNIDITPTLKLNLTGHTDFAQVESDRARINLSRFSIYYPEKRQFFLEGKDMFGMNMGRRTQLFYSRRIGIQSREEVPIIAGIRLFGKENKTNIGLLSIQTAAKDTIPTTNYSVVRIRQDILKKSSIGMIATSKILNGRYNFVCGADINYSTSKLFGNKNLVINAALAQSHTSDSVNTRNLAYHASLAYHNDIIEYDLAMFDLQENFNPEMGFMRYHNYRMYYTELQFNPRPKFLPFFRNIVLKPIDVNYYVNSRTNKTDRIFYEWRPLGFITRSGEFMEFNVQHIYNVIRDPFNLYDTIYISPGNYLDNRFELQFESFSGRKLSLGFAGSAGDFYTGTRIEIETQLNLNLNKHWNLSADWTRNYVNLRSQNFITDEVGGRVMYACNPKLNTSLFGQWNTEDQELLLNYRINWIPKIGSDFYFVINQIISTENRRFIIERTTVLAKFIWRFAM